MAGLVSMLRRQAGPNALPRIYYRAAVLGCAGHRKTGEEGLGLTLVTGVAHCLSGTHRMGPLLGPKGENRHWLRAWVCSESKGGTWSWSAGEKGGWGSCPLQRHRPMSYDRLET